MIFVAKNLDASNNNLGKVPIKGIEDVSRETYEIIGAYGNKSFTDDQIIAIDDFLIGLKSLSTYSKFTFFILPILAPQTSKGSLDKDTKWTDTNPCYDIIHKERLQALGFNGYVDKHGLKVYKEAGVPAAISFNEPISLNTETLTVGACINPDRMQFVATMYETSSNNKTASAFGAVEKKTTIIYDIAPLESEDICVTTMSRNSSEAYGVRNNIEGHIETSVNEPYRSNPYSLQKISTWGIDTTITSVLSFMFICNNYMMNEEELKEINKLCYDLMVALW